MGNRCKCATRKKPRKTWISKQDNRPPYTTKTPEKEMEYTYPEYAKTTKRYRWIHGKSGKSASGEKAKKCKFATWETTQSPAKTTNHADKPGRKDKQTNRLYTNKPHIQKRNKTSTSNKRMAGQHGITKTQSNKNANMPKTHEKL